MKPSDFIYCPKCRQEIAPKKLIKKIKEEESERCTNPLTGGYLDKYEYAFYIDKYFILKCPNDDTVLDKIFIGTEEKNG